MIFFIFCLFAKTSQNFQESQALWAKWALNTRFMPIMLGLLKCCCSRFEKISQYLNPAYWQHQDRISSLHTGLFFCYCFQNDWAWSHLFSKRYALKNMATTFRKPEHYRLEANIQYSFCESSVFFKSCMALQNVSIRPFKFCCFWFPGLCKLQSFCNLCLN